MSALETAAQPILTPLILGQAQTLDQASSLLISQWVALKVFVGEQSQIGDVVTSHEQREAFRTTLTIPNSFRIWIGKCGVEGWEAAYWRNAATISLSPDIKPEHRNKNVHSVTFGIGYLLVYAFHTTVDNTDFDFSFEQQQIAKALYPIRDVVKWPPFKSVTAYGASVIAYALNDLLHGPRVFWKPLPD